MKVVIDTNIIISAMLSLRGLPAKLLSLVLKGKLILLYDDRILSEYINVLQRKKFGFSKSAIEEFISFVIYNGETINPEPIKQKWDDEDDKKFYEVFRSGGAKYLITGNKKHYPKANDVLTPRDFFEKQAIK